MTPLTTEPLQAPEIGPTTRIQPEQAAGRVRADHDILLCAVEGRTDFELAAAYRIDDERPGEYCDSLHDLLAHVLMWDEIALGVLLDARRGRAHWSLDAECETRAARMQLNWSGVAAGRHLPAWLLLHRLVSVSDALVRELASAECGVWTSAVGEVVQDTLTAADAPPFWHAAHHLRRLPYNGASPVGVLPATRRPEEQARRVEPERNHR